MIKLTRLSGTEILINENYIEIIEEVPDTVIRMQNNHSIVVSEKLDDIIRIIKENK